MHPAATADTASIAAAAACRVPQYFGVDVNTGGVVNTFEAFVWEPALVKLNAIQVRPEPMA
jgi:chaperonin GroEL (HSP60 family)